MQTMGGGGSEGTEAIPIHQLHQRSELIMLSHMWTLSLTASLLFALLKFSCSSSVVSFTQCSPTCGNMPLPALSLWPGRQPYRPRLVVGRRGGGPSSVAPRSRNPPTGRRRESPISSSLFSHSPPLCAVG